MLESSQLYIAGLIINIKWAFVGRCKRVGMPRSSGVVKKINI